MSTVAIEPPLTGGYSHTTAGVGVGMAMKSHPGLFAHDWYDGLCEHCEIEYDLCEEEVQTAECPVRLRVVMDALCKSPEDRGWDVVYRELGVVITGERGIPIDMMGAITAIGAVNGFDLIDARLSGHFPEACMVLTNKESGAKWRAQLGLEVKSG
jgi:hypothetical protein